MKKPKRPRRRRWMRLFRTPWCWMRRLQLFAGIVGRRDDGDYNCRIRLGMAWQVARDVEDRPYRRGETL